MVTVISNKLKAELLPKRKEFEQKVKEFDGQRMWYQEKYYQIPGICKIESNDWGIVVTITSEHRDKPLTVSGRWDVMVIHQNGIGAQYCGWSITSDRCYDELGINMSPFKYVGEESE